MNNSSQSLANKYRPRVFDDVLGQVSAVKSLQGKLLENRLPQTSLFCGAHGAGKTTLARIVAKAVNCQNPKEDGNPCCKCESCRSIDAGVSTDVIEMDAASHNKVEDAEQIVKQAGFLPTGKKKVIILDEFHMMTKEAQNKLLKIVEEPPAHVIFIFCTTEERRILPTILSRCNKFTFRGISNTDILENLKKICVTEGFEYEEDALKLIVKSADGHVRDSLSVLEQLSYQKLTAERVAQTLGLASHEQVFTLLQSIVVEDMKGMLTFLEDIFSLGNVQAFLKEVVYILCYLLTYDPQVPDGETEEFRQQVGSLREYLAPEKALAFIKIITQALKDNRGMGLELATRIAFLSMLTEVKKDNRIAMLEEEVKKLKQQMGSSVVVAKSVSPVNVSMDEKTENFVSETLSPETIPVMQEMPVSEETATFTVSEMPWPEEMDFDAFSDTGGFADGFMPIAEEEASQMPVMTDTSFKEIPKEEVVEKSTPVYETSAGVAIPGGNVHPKQEEATSSVGFAIPGGNVHPKEEKKEEKEAPVMGGFNDAGFGNSFAGGLFGSTGASFFG